MLLNKAIRSLPFESSTAKAKISYADEFLVKIGFPDISKSCRSLYVILP